MIFHSWLGLSTRHLSTRLEGHFDCFQFGATENKAIVDISVEVIFPPVDVFSSHLDIILRGVIAGLYGKIVYLFSKTTL